MITTFNKKFSILEIRKTGADFVFWVLSFLVVVEFSTMEKKEKKKCR